MSGKLLVVDDDVELCHLVSDVLHESGYGVQIEPDGASGLHRVRTEPYDLMILDVMLPGADGFSILKQVRQESQLPVLMLSARAARQDRICGLRAGADDYLPKPFHPEELLARVGAILRRAGAAPSSNGPSVLCMGELRFFRASRQASYEGRALDLTAMEADILECLLRSAGETVSRDQLSLLLYHRVSAPFERSIDTHISRIRNKLGEAREMIMSVRGSGYQARLMPPR